MTDASINPFDFAPAYYQLARLLREQIMSGKLRPGDRIPSEEKLGETHGLSRMTVKKAISLLVDEGLLRSERGRGTFVIHPRVDGGLLMVPDFREEMSERGVTTKVNLLSVSTVKAPKLVAGKLDLKKGKSVLYLERILEAKKEPLIFDRKYMICDPDQPLLESEIGHGSTSELFRENPDLTPLRSDLNLTATTLNKREAELLASHEGMPALCVEQLLYAANDLKVIWGWRIYRGDRFSFRSLSRSM